MARQHNVNLCQPAGKGNGSGQRGTMHNNKNLQCHTVHSVTSQLHKCINRLSNHISYMLNYYVREYNETKTPTIIVNI